jgi:hypothetical protein
MSSLRGKRLRFAVRVLAFESKEVRMLKRISSRFVLVLLVSALALALLPVALVVQPVLAGSADFANFDFVAAGDATYDHLTGGGAYNDGAKPSVFEELEATSYACGEIVTFLTRITVADAPVDLLQTINLDYNFTLDTTGQSGAALGDIVGVGVNYGDVENGDDGTGTPPGAGFFGLDSGIDDDRQNVVDGDSGVGGSTATLVGEGLTGPMFTAGSLLTGTVQLDDLEPTDQVIVRVDVRIYCQDGASPTGNLQAKLMAAYMVSPPTGDAIPGAGVQTIPFKQVGKLKPPPSAVELASFAATAAGRAILLEWETASEVDNLGFNLYRAGSPDGPRAQINGGLIPARMPGSPIGAAYQFLDGSVTPGITYYYWLEDVDVYGVATLHGPVSAKLGAVYRLLPGRPRPAPLPMGRQR